MEEPDPTRAEGPGAFELAVGALSRKERTIAELGEWLRARGAEEADVAEALERLIAVGELDDERFAHRYAEDKRELRGWGPERIRDALMDRGVDRGLAERAAGSESQAEQAERAAALLLGRGTALDDDASRGKALAYLARRGYSSDAAYSAVRLAERQALRRAA